MKNTMEMAIEAGIIDPRDAYSEEHVQAVLQAIKAFEALVRADEREQALAEPVQPVAHCEQGPNFCKQCANQQAEDCAAILYRDHNENPWVHVIQKDLPSGTKLIAITKGQP